MGTEKSPSSPFEETFEKIQKPVDTWTPSDHGHDSDEFDFGLQEEGEGKSQPKPEEPENDWASFQAMTSGIDSIVKQKKDDLDSLKVTSYYQRKKTQDEIGEDARLARPKNLVGARKKRWVDLDQDGFEEREGVIVEDVSEAEETDAEVDEDEPVAQDENDLQPSPKEETPVEEEAKQEVEEEEKEEDDIFDTEFVNEQLAVLDLKLNEIPDSPIDEGPDVFDTNYASDIVHKAEKERA